MYVHLGVYIQLYFYAISQHLHKNSRCVRVLLLQSGVILWQSTDTPIMSSFCVSVLYSCALLSACLVSCCSMAFGSRHSCLEFWFVSGFGHSCSMFCLLVWACSLEFDRPCALLSMCLLVLHAVYRLCAFMWCLVLWGTQLVYFIGCVLSCCHVLCEHVAYGYSH